MHNWQQNLNALIIIILSGVLLAGFGVQIFLKEEPCPLCMLQRLGMIGVASGLLLNVWFGVQTSHYGLSIFSALMGGSVALRQIALHVCPGFPVFGTPVLGLSLYSWSFIVFACSLFAIGLLLFLYSPKDEAQEKLQVNNLSKLAFLLIFLVTIANIFTTYFQCGLGPCQ